MNGRSADRRTHVLLSFSRRHADLARRLAYDLRAAGIVVRLDQWDGGGGVPAVRCAPCDVDDAAFVLPLISGADTPRCWIDEEWRRAVLDAAQRRGIAVLPIRGERCDAVPGFLEGRSFADLANRGYVPELRRLVARIRRRSGESAIRPAPTGVRSAADRSSEFLAARPIVVELGPALMPLFPGGDRSDSPFREFDGFVRDGMHYELGVLFPRLALRRASDRASTDARIVINDVEEARIELHLDRVMANERVDSLAERGFDALAAINPATGGPCGWIPAERAAEAEAEGLTTWDARGVLVLLTATVIRRNAAQFLGMPEVQAMLDEVGQFFPILAAEAVPAAVSLNTLTDVLRRLVAEEVGIRNLPRILHAVAELGPRERDPLRLTESVREALKRQIVHRLEGGAGQFVVLLLDEGIEESIRGAIRRAPTGDFVDLEPDRLGAIVEAIRAPFAELWTLPFAVRKPSILTTADIRSHVRRIVAPSMPWLEVVSHSELTARANPQPVARISLTGFRSLHATAGGIPVWTRS